MFDKYLDWFGKRAPNFLTNLYKDSLTSFQYKKEAKNRPILVIPGFMTNDHSTTILRAALVASGFNPYTWDHGTNVIASNMLLDSLEIVLQAIYNDNGQPVTIIGWSMGGFYARFLANKCPNMVNSVITLGTPFKKPINIEEMREKYTKIGINIDDFPVDDTKMNMMMATPPVPFTSIYSNIDSIALAENCKDIDSRITENVEVATGHFGMVCDPEALKVIIDRCLQEKSSWEKYIS